MAVASSLSTTFSLLHSSLSAPPKPAFLSFTAGGVPSLSLRNSRRVFIQAKVYEQEGEESEIEEEDETSSELYESSEEVDELASEEEGGEEIGSEFSVEISNEPTEVVAEKPPKKSASSANGSQQIKTNSHLRIKLKSYWVPLIEDTCKQILEAARTTNAKTVGPVPLPTKKRIYCVLKSPHKHKDAREHFEIRTHIRLIDIVQPTLETVEALSELEFPAGVDVKLKF